jgi:hypothetical protein
MEKSNTIKFTVTIPPELKERIRQQAEKESRNVSNMTVVLLTEALKKKSA